MIILKYPKKTELTETWREKLEELAVGFKVEEDTELEKAIISEKGKDFIGDAAVSDFVIELEKFVHAWRDPKCGV
jgi:hypothetical protein